LKISLNFEEQVESPLSGYHQLLVRRSESSSHIIRQGT